MPISLHNWLLISACILTFLVLPLLFIWSSLGAIHTRVSGHGVFLSDAGHIDPLKKLFKKNRVYGK